MISVAKYFGGGGHDDRGGFNIESFDQVKKVTNKLNQAIKEW
ncbi:Uncharacterised protein, partial [Mycoplasmopsis edwardii]